MNVKVRGGGLIIVLQGGVEVAMGRRMIQVLLIAHRRCCRVVVLVDDHPLPPDRDVAFKRWNDSFAGSESLCCLCHDDGGRDDNTGHKNHRFETRKTNYGSGHKVHFVKSQRIVKSQIFGAATKFVAPFVAFITGEGLDMVQFL